jgi:hypothetical protein
MKKNGEGDQDQAWLHSADKSSPAPDPNAIELASGGWFDGLSWSCLGVDLDLDLALDPPGNHFEIKSKIKIKSKSKSKSKITTHGAVL